MVNVDVTAPGAIIALSLMFLKVKRLLSYIFLKFLQVEHSSVIVLGYKISHIS